MLIIESGGHIQRIARFVSLRKRRIVGLFQIQLAALEFLVQHTGLNTNAQRASQHLALIGILCRQTLVLEQSDIVAHQLQAHAVIAVQQIDWHVACDEHRLGVVFKSCHTHGVGSRHVYQLLLSDGSRIKRRFQRPIVSEGNVLLCRNSCQHHQQQAQKRYFTSKHVINNAKYHKLLFFFVNLHSKHSISN